MSMNQLMLKLQGIAEECNVKEKRDKNAPPADEFTKKKRQIVAELKVCRKNLKARDELLCKAPDSKEAASMSQNVRTNVKEIKKEARLLSALQRKDEQKISKKKTVEPEEREAVDRRKQLVANIFKHIDEVEKLEKRRYNIPTDDEEAGPSRARRDELLGTAGKGKAALPADPTESHLDDIEIEEALIQLQRGNEEIDMELEELAAGVGVVKEVVVEMKHELEVQEVMIDHLDGRVDDVNAHLKSSRRNLDKVIEEASNSGDKFIVYFIFLVIILACGVFVWNKASE